MKPSRKSRSCSTSHSQGDAEKIVQRLAVIRAAVQAGIAELEAERAEHRRKIEKLRSAELAAPRKRSIYFHLARLIIDGLHPEIVMPWLRTPEALRKTAKALEIAEKDVDRDGLRVVKSFLAALRKHLKLQNVHKLPLAALRNHSKNLKLEQIREQYRKLYPTHRVPEDRSISRTLRRKELWNFKRGRHKEDGDKSG